VPQGAIEENKKVTAASWEKAGELKIKKVKKKEFKTLHYGI